MLPPFDLIEPKTLPDALAALAEGGGQPLAGGTNLFPDLRGGRESSRQFIDLSGIDGLRYISHEAGRVTLGAGATMADILRDGKINDAAPALRAAADRFAGTMVRTAATIGGNVCCGSPAADTVPALLTLDAEVELTSAEGARRLPLSEFYLGYKKTAMKPSELMTAVSFAPAPKGSSHLFYKLARRKGDAITVTGVAVLLSKEAGKCASVRIALGSVAPTVFRAREAEDLLTGQDLTPELIEAAAKAATDQSSPIADNRASANYRLLTVHSLVRRLLRQAWAQAS